METALSALHSEGEQEFLRVTATALKIVQNILSWPSQDRYRRVRSSSRYCSKAGVPHLLEALGFELRSSHYALDETFVSSLLSKKREIQSARKNTGSLLGYDIPFSSLRFSSALGSCKYGEVFRGMVDEEEVAVKTLKPDGGERGRESFHRELEVLYKLSHPNIIQLLAVTLTSDPTSIILEYLPTSMLDLLHSSDGLSDSETLSLSLQVASAVEYLHSLDILHCDLGARNIRITKEHTAKLCDFGSSRRYDSESSQLSAEQSACLSVRWTAPEILRDQLITKRADVWSYGVFLYEMVTNGSVPYASFSNQEVKTKVLEGYHLPQPYSCSDELYLLMLHCWLPRATERPNFHSICHTHLEPLRTKCVEGGGLTRQNSTTDEAMELKSSTLKNSRSSSKLKMKEPSYPQVVAKGGGLVRVYSALISPFLHRLVVVCAKKTTVAEVVQMALFKCGKPDLNYKSHSLALVTPQAIDSPAHYLNPSDHILAVKDEAAVNALFVLCMHIPGPTILEVVNSVKQNPAYSTAFDCCTRGYLLTSRRSEGGKGGGGGEVGKGGKQKADEKCWCVLDGSTLICYKDEEDENRKQFDHFVDLKNCSVALVNAKKSNLVRVGLADGGQFFFSASDKPEMLQWIEAIETASRLQPSSLLLHATGGAIMATGFLECQEFALDVGGVSPLQSVLSRRLGSASDFSGSYSAIDYGKHWTVLKNSGLLQCLVHGQPQTLLSLIDAKRVCISNPKGSSEDNYCIEVECERSRVVLKAECPSDHFDWVLAFERVLRAKGMQSRLRGDRGKQSGYVTLKHLLATTEGGVRGGGGVMEEGVPDQRKQLYIVPRCFNQMDDLYESQNPLHPTTTATPSSSSSLPNGTHSSSADPSLSPPPPPPPPAGHSPHTNSATYVNCIPPPPLPPRSSAPPPPLPPKGTQSNFSEQMGTSHSTSSDLNDLGDYIIMQPQTPSLPSPSSSMGSVPSTPLGAHPMNSPSSPSSSVFAPSPSQPIIIPDRRPGKQSKLLRSDSEISSGSSQAVDSSVSDIRVWGSPVTIAHHSLTEAHNHQFSEQMLSKSLSSYQHPSSGEHDSSVTAGATMSLHHCLVRYQTPLLGGDRASPVRSQSNRFVGSDQGGVTSEQQVLPEDTNQSDGMAVGEVRVCGRHHPISQPGSLTDGVGSKKPLEGGVQPGGKWQVVTMDDGQVYYYNELTRQTTWDVQDTFS